MSATKDKQWRDTAVYVGRRLYPNRTTRQVFLRGGKEMHFNGVVGVRIGYTYRCSAKGIAKRPERVDVERVDNAEWDAADAIVSAFRAEQSAEKKLARSTSPALKHAVDALRPLVRSINIWQQKQLVEYLVFEAGRTTKTKKR